MNIIYSRWRDDSQTAEQQLERLLNLFTYVLLQVNADSEQALDIIRQLDEKYGILGEMTMDEYIDLLKAQGLLNDNPDGGFDTSKKALGKIRKDALNEIFRNLKKNDIGTHDTPHSGSGHERLPETRDYVFGDQAANIDITQTISNALQRESELDRFSLHEDDIRVFETEHLANCATVLMIDISHSMILYGEDRITPAKQVAMALAELIMTKYPKDLLEVLVFGDEARRVNVESIPFISVGPFHTNTRDGLRLARQLLKRARGTNKQIFMVTDGKPSAMFDDAGRLYKNSFGLDPRIVNKTLDEAVACRREGITISTFMVARDSYLVHFIEQLTQANNGRAFYSGLDRLGETIFVDYINNRKKKFRNG
ncbi:MAG: hypothetical protein JNL32_01515 [Candidatus Kapabacteria bacterium]|nr:hypothetical protein [Candidatus Kapabacteria bacterium]